MITIGLVGKKLAECEVGVCVGLWFPLLLFVSVSSWCVVCSHRTVFVVAFSL